MSVYLLHLDSPMPRGVSKSGKPLYAGHYIGSADDIESRLQEHENTTWEPLPAPLLSDGKVCVGRKYGDGSNFIAVANYRGITWRLARVWKKGGRKLERRLKNYKNAPRLCPICKMEDEK